MTPLPDVDVLVIGEALIDIVQTEEGHAEFVGGSPANVALGLGRRGVAVGLLTHLARDRRGLKVIEHLQESGVRVLDESLHATSTSTAVATIAPDGQADYEFDLEWAVRVPSDGNPRVIHTGSIAAFLEPGAAAVRDILRATDARDITFDPNIRPALIGRHEDAFPVFEDTARLATVVKLSDQDAEWLYPGVAPDLVLDAIMELGPRLAAITLGSEGAILVTPEDRVWIPAITVPTVDTIGAGDTFMSALIHAILLSGSERLEREALERIGHDAAAAAAITVSRAGADLPWASELTA